MDEWGKVRHTEHLVCFSLNLAFWPFTKKRKVKLLCMNFTQMQEIKVFW